MAVMQGSGCILAVAAIMLASTCTAYTGMQPDITGVELDQAMSAEGNWHQGGQHLRRLAQGGTGSTAPVVGGVGTSSTGGTPTSSAGAAAANDTSSQAQTAGTGASGGAGSAPIVGAATPGTTAAPSTTANVTGQPANFTDSDDQGARRGWGSGAAVLGAAAAAAAAAGALW